MKSDHLFPQGLLRWAGHREGGVKKPFDSNSGRPTSTHLRTGLVSRLDKWVERFVAGDDVPKTLLLVGGPGNGKTDAVEGLVQRLDHDLGLAGRLFDAFAKIYATDVGVLPPRRADVELASLGAKLPDGLDLTFSIVQDATEKDPLAPEREPHEILLSELREVAECEFEGVYVCCVNRGILAHASRVAHAGGHESVLDLLEAIGLAVTSSMEAPDCWPLGDYPGVVAWPMDLESLIVPSGEGERSVAHQVFDAAQDPSRWAASCLSEKLCPFCTNRRLLDSEDARVGLLRMLRAYELGEAKRWTFRDLFSLVPLLYVGTDGELAHGEGAISPCDWTEARVDFMESASTSHRLDALGTHFLLASRLYWWRLFPRWPRLNSGAFLAAKRAVLKVKKGTAPLDPARGFFHFLARPRPRFEGVIPRLLAESLSPRLDPAFLSADSELVKGCSVRELDKHFSLSVGEGVRLVESHFEPLEREVLRRLADADDGLSSSLVSRLHGSQARMLQSAIRQFAARLTKRALGARSGLFQLASELEQYDDAISSRDSLRQSQKQLGRLLNEGADGGFRASLTTTFAQPMPPESEAVTLRTDRVRVKVPASAGAASDKRPRATLPFLTAGDYPVALTFALYRALADLGAGMSASSLPDDVHALVDGIRARIAGRVVRDYDALEDESSIVLGRHGDQISWYLNGFHVQPGSGE